MTILRYALAGCLLGAAAFAATGSVPPTAPQVIEQLRMQKIPGEGAWFAVTHESADRIPAGGLPPRYGASRLAGTAIYALVTRTDFSAMHRLKTDEVWHFYSGDPIELLLLHPDGRGEVVVVGPDLFGGQKPQFTVPAGVWMGARPLRDAAESYSLFGCTMAPGFDYADYEPGYRAELQAEYPDQSDLIEALTRVEFLKKPVPLTPETVSAPGAVASPTVFNAEAVKNIAVAPGVELRELIGRVGHARSGDVSVARFALAPGKGTGTSYQKVGEEIFLIISGRGTVVLGRDSTPVAAGAVVILKPGVRHSLTADAGEALEFYAITLPAFSPEDYVRVE